MEKITDHLGKKFNTIKEMCQYWNITTDAYKYRKKANWSLEKILTTSVKENSKSCRDHLGNEFKSEKEMCDNYDINVVSYRRRLLDGWSLKDALTTPIKKRNRINKFHIDHLGNEFNSEKEMYEYWGIPRDVYRGRIRLGWSIKDVLTTPLKKKG